MHIIALFFFILFNNIIIPNLSQSLFHQTRLPLIRKNKAINLQSIYNNKDDINNIGIGRRRRLSLLMDSFIDPIISDDYFYAVLYVGSPQSQRVEMALDTGSGLPYFACLSTCIHCGKHDDIPYIIENSTSFNWISCKHKLCGGGHCKKLNLKNSNTNNNNNENVCEWTQKYVDKSSIHAAVGSDLISFYKYPFLPLDTYRITAKMSKNTSLTIPSPLENEKKLRLIFGCSEQEANTIFRQGADGVMGLSMHHRSFVDQLFNNNNNDNIDLGHKQFAHCFGAKTGGLLLFGSIEIDDLINKFNINPIWTPFITSNSGHGWYRVKTVGFTVVFNENTPKNGMDMASTNDNDIKPIDVNYQSDIRNGYHGSVIDTGSSTLSMPRKPSKDIMDAILKLVHTKIDKNVNKFEWTKDITKNYDFFLQWNGKKTMGDDDWIKFKNEFIKYFPDIIMLWNGEDGKDALKFTIPVERYLLFKKPHICLDLFGDTPSILVGSNVMVNKFMIYDREKMKLGVADINCDALLMQDEDDKMQENPQINVIEAPSPPKEDTAPSEEPQSPPEEIKPQSPAPESTKKEEEPPKKETPSPTPKPIEPLQPKLTLPPTKTPSKNMDNDVKKEQNEIGNGQKKTSFEEIEEREPLLILPPRPNFSKFFMYFVVIIVCILFVYVIYHYCFKKDKKGGKRGGTGSNVKYQRVDTKDPDEDEMDERRLRQHNHRRKRNVTSSMDGHASSSGMSLNNMNNINVNMDILSMTTPTQNFTSKQHKMNNNNNNNNSHSNLQYNQDAI